MENRSELPSLSKIFSCCRIRGLTLARFIKCSDPGQPLRQDAVGTIGVNALLSAVFPNVFPAVKPKYNHAARLASKYQTPWEDITKLFVKQSQLLPPNTGFISARAVAIKGHIL